MRITIAERLRPFSHISGNKYPLPGSSLCLQIFPSLIRIFDLSFSEPQLLSEITLGIKGPVKDFTVALDLEKGNICIWGFAADGYFRYRISAILQHQQSFLISIEKKPVQGISISTSKNFQISQTLANPKDRLIVAPQGVLCQNFDIYVPPLAGRLSLGNHKSQDWEFVKYRQDLKEIFPVWYLLGQLLPSFNAHHFEGTAAFLKECREAIENSSGNFLQSFLNLFQAGFEGILSPRLRDEQYLGFSLPPISNNSKLSPLILLKEGADLIQKVFIKQINNTIEVLPALPPEFHCGRFINISCGQFGVLHFEWSKKIIQRMIFYSKISGSIQFKFQKELQSFRLREGGKDHGKMHSCISSIDVEKEKIYYLDNFKK